ncbi:DNA primase small subunit [Strongyloides ratti]|uniref:DNA primase n=1 Tax=Strongyloides ratti TaxID=34506 RepID=A0A090LCX5_STRRB|nr:DNA primase small subunit [Strongyloides ratti]CEF67607.1 DNA primase small subunit [Strongyloides ratti]
MDICNSFDPETLPQYLSKYYSSIFPVNIFTKWLTYGKDFSELFEKREFVFVLTGDVHLRYRSFATPMDFYKELCHISPEKLDIGGVFNYPPKDHKLHSDFSVVEREFVIDIDLTDYDTIRTCCKEANVCDKCWKFAIIAVRVLENALKTHFGFKNFIFLFSGRRGIHCWVSDEIARRMNNSERAAVIGYLNLNKEDITIEGPSFTYGKIHPLFEETIDIVLNMETFNEIMVEQDWLDDNTTFATVNFREPLTSFILKSFEVLEDNRKLKWQFIKNLYHDYHNPDRYVFEKMLKKFILKVIYPKLDVNVSASTNHLLKSPFCVHPKTGKVAVPLNLEELESIKLKDFPTIEKLVGEIQENCPTDENHKNNEMYKTTSLAPYVKIFEDFVNKCT